MKIPPSTARAASPLPRRMPGLMVSLGFLGTLIGLTTGLSGFDMADAEAVQELHRHADPRHALCLHDLHRRRHRLDHLHADHPLCLRLGRARPRRTFTAP